MNFHAINGLYHEPYYIEILEHNENGDVHGYWLLSMEDKLTKKKKYYKTPTPFILDALEMQQAGKLEEYKENK